ncbi:MAG TPA: hypothetical protein VF244_07575, partial [Acidimicrobiales bacterium]
MGRIRLGDTRGRVLVAAILALVVAGALVASLGSRTSDDEAGALGSSRASAPVVDDGFATVGASIAEAGGGSGADASRKQIGPVPPDGGGSTPVPGSPRIVRTGELRVNVGKDGFGAAFDRVASIAAAHGGFVASSSTSTIDDARAGELT